MVLVGTLVRFEGKGPTPKKRFQKLKKQGYQVTEIGPDYIQLSNGRKTLQVRPTHAATRQPIQDPVMRKSVMDFFVHFLRVTGLLPKD